ncbi:MAG: SGNH/GDSL hydrolase family protein [Burkholderiaceae bacterium]|nr:SGNH/GDSL hydrolase family protein [Burkholderiaceae bacterium]
MHRCKRMLAAATIAASWAVTANAASFQSLVVFGDSLSDNGNAGALTANYFPPSVNPPGVYYYPGRFSNGPVAAEYMASALGATLHDHAVGGATTGTLNYNYEVNSPGYLASFPALATTGMAAQVAGFSMGSLNPSRTLFMLWGGPNDIFLELSKTVPDLSAAIGGAMHNIAGEIQTLALQGASHFFVPNMPDLGKTPEAVANPDPTVAPGLTFISNQFNAALAATLQGVQLALPGATVYSFDTAAYMNGVIAGAPGNGYSDVTHGCLFAGAAPDCTGFLYYDSVHPTTAAHAQLGSAFAAAVPEPETYALMLGGLALLAVWARRRASPAR